MSSNKENKPKKENKLLKNLGLIIIPAVIASTITGVVVDKKHDDGKVVISVEDKEITKSQIKDKLYNLYSGNYAQEFINVSLLELQAEKLKVKVTDKEIDEEYNKLLKESGDEAAFLEEIKTYYGNVETFKGEVIRIQLLLSKTMYEEFKPTEKELKAYYEENKAKFETAEQVSASHILLKTEEEAKEIIEQLKKSDDVTNKFVELADSKSLDTNTGSGGNLGYFGKGNMVAEFEEAAFSLKKGDYSKEPVKTEYGYHVILVNDKIEAEASTFEKDKELAKENYMENIKNEKLTNWLEGLKKEFEITNKINK